ADEQLREDHAGLDGLAEPDFVGQQHAYRSPPRYRFGDAQLVRDQLHACRHQAPGRRASRVRAMQQCRRAKVEAFGTVDAAGDQARVGLRYILYIVEFAFAERVVAAEIVEYAIGRLDTFDDETAAVSGDTVAGAKLRTLQRCGVRGVGTHGSARREGNVHGALLDAQHGAESEFRLGDG